MKKLKIVLLYNNRHSYPDPNDYRNQLEADFDDPETTEWQIRYLKRSGFEVIPIEANENAYLRLYRLRKKIDLVFNVSEGIYGLDREAQLPAMLEMLQIPYLGSRPLTQAIILDKAKTKEVLSFHGIPNLPFQVLRRSDEIIDTRLKFPLIVKPVAQGSSAGVTNESVVFSVEQLRHQAKKIIETFFQQPVIIEPFLSGREFSVPMMGNPPRILPIIEPNHKLLPKNYLPLDSLEVKWHFEEKAGSESYLQCPARLSRKLERKIKEICLQTWKALEIRDWCRIDIRCDREENPYVLEVNSPPGIIPPEVSRSSYFPLSARAAKISYQQLLEDLVKIALERYRKNYL
ncbi:MAG: ATP-grasp domain-containing protein [Patescibacteria group bacterium]|nr:ATP-grasp domain-containing protein [Patescibacteria group bacterium]